MMRVSTKHKFIFFHVHKTGGTSIASALEDVSKDPFNDRHLRPSTAKRRISNKFRKYFKFAFVRNPWDRMVSCYTYDAQNTRGFQKGKKFYGMSFADYLQLRLVDARKWWVEPQLYWLTNRGTFLVDFVGRFEHLQSDFDKICAKVNLKPRKLLHKRKSIRKVYQKYYNSDTQKIVEKEYTPDIKEFGYTFGRAT